ncbi:hypothetical protein VTJ04DRAFT_9278 [Mycothermus thermophilus]|uniref:uncharacterized protein n=1 Tax=Humicola insolens TaxID=85995 RepID=UPI0037422CE9
MDEWIVGPGGGKMRWRMSGCLRSGVFIILLYCWRLVLLRSVYRVIVVIAVIAIVVAVVAAVVTVSREDR